MAAGKGADAGLTVVDHISQSTHYEDMLSWLLFYTSLFDVQKTPQVDINDPGGVVRSQVVETADGALRIALNASQSTRTQSSRFLNEYFGSGVQHIAFATDDILATAARLKANGVETLRIPENYYDDLEARVDLGGDRLKMLKANNVLYDKDDNGEYFQLYTQSFKDLFFLEIVQRRGYKGFGAINAPIRLNAQSRLAGENAVSEPVTTPLRIAVVGAGAIGRAHIDRILKSRDCRLVAIVDPAPGASEIAAKAGRSAARLAARLAEATSGRRHPGNAQSTSCRAGACLCCGRRIRPSSRSRWRIPIENAARLCEAAERAKVKAADGTSSTAQSDHDQGGRDREKWQARAPGGRRRHRDVL